MLQTCSMKEKGTLYPLPLIYSREREVLREGSGKAEQEMADNQGLGGVLLKNLELLVACLAFAALKTTHSLDDNGSAFLLGSGAIWMQ